jgi:UDP-N-acetylglucosamine diphosphorylase/glucosamine-1-phosphate N-acetyltransferase
MRIGTFEDKGYEDLQPLTYLRPIFDLRCGMYLMREKVQKLLTGMNMDFFVRKELEDFVTEKNPGIAVNKTADEDYLFINGRAIFTKNTLDLMTNSTQTLLYKREGEVVAAFVLTSDLKKLDKNPDGTLNFDNIAEWRPADKEIKILKYPWEFVHENADEIAADYSLATQGVNSVSKEINGVHLMAPENIRIAASAQIDPGVVIDARNGPVYIDEDAHIFPQATIIGPAYIGRNTLVKIGAKIYEGTSLGEFCKVGGEVKESIIHSYSNKKHDGFLGHAYLGQWVNLGADTNNSDLKNNYGSVRVYVNGKEVDSGSSFVGLTMGDHSKSGINTMFNTGTVVGIMCNIFGSDFPPKWIPDFSWGGSGGFTEHDVDRGLAVAGIVMERRKITLGPAEEKLIRRVFKRTRGNRR